MNKYDLRITKSLTYQLHGGPYRNKPDDMLGVKMAKEINLPYEVSIPTRDFDVPKLSDLNKGIEQVLQLIAKGKSLYVGCAGGIGRTGLLFAILSKLFGSSTPIKDVREGYNPHAVETEDQKGIVNDFTPTLKIKLLVLWVKIVATVFSTFNRL